MAFHSLADLRKLVFAKLRRLAPAKLDRQDSEFIKNDQEDIGSSEVFLPIQLHNLFWGLSLFSLCGYFSRISPALGFWLC